MTAFSRSIDEPFDMVRTSVFWACAEGKAIVRSVQKGNETELRAKKETQIPDPYNTLQNMFRSLRLVDGPGRFLKCKISVDGRLSQSSKYKMAY